MVELRLHGGAVNAVYTDALGRFGFGGLEANTYYIVIEDSAYYPVSERVDLRPEAPNATLQLVLRPREDTKGGNSIDSRVAGANPYLTDAAEYNKRFPKKAVNEYKRGLQAESKGKGEEAIAHYQAALKIAPDYYPAVNNLGALYLRCKDFKSAETQFQEAIRLEPKESQAYFNLGNLFLLTGRYSESEAMLAAGLQRRPDSAFAHFLQGSLFESTGRFVEAERNLREAVRLDPTMSQARLVLVNVYLRQNRKEDAVHQLQDFLKAFPEAPMAAKAKEVLNRLQREEPPQSR
jgi:tetratricopeptide (TPR) repeat protein